MNTWTLFLCCCVGIAFGATPPAWGEYGSNTKNYELLTVKIKGLKCIGPHHAYVMYPKEAISQKKNLPFLAFGHGADAGGDGTYVLYKDLWHQVASFGYIIAGPKSCEPGYCSNFWEDLQTTIEYIEKEKGSLNKVFDYALFDKVGLYGHSMGGAATVHVSDNAKELNITASVALHPSIGDPHEHDRNEAADVKVPILFFSGSADVLVPPKEVIKGFNVDPILPKIFAEITNATHMEPTNGGLGREQPYVAAYFECMIKNNSNNACQYFFDKNDTANNICTGGVPMTQCIINGTKIYLK